jgi:hypothetical protein
LVEQLQKRVIAIEAGQVVADGVFQSSVP